MAHRPLIVGLYSGKVYLSRFISLKCNDNIKTVLKCRVKTGYNPSIQLIPFNFICIGLKNGHCHRRALQEYVNSGYNQFIVYYLDQAVALWLGLTIFWPLASTSHANVQMPYRGLFWIQFPSNSPYKETPTILSDIVHISCTIFRCFSWLWFSLASSYSTRCAYCS